MVSVVDLGMVGAVSVDARDAGRSRSSSCRPSSAVRRSASSRPPSPTGWRRSASRSTSRPTFRIPWTSDRITPAGRRALATAGIAGPSAPDAVRCPYCASGRVVMDSVVRPDPVPLAALLPRLPPAVRGDEAGLMMAASPPGTVVVGVVGAGTMGAGIAQLALEAGHPVVMHDVDAAAIEAGRARIRAGLERRAARLDLDPESAEAWVEGRLARLEGAPTLDLLAAAGPGLVIEAALEDLEAKRTIFRTLDAGRPHPTPSWPRTRAPCRSARSPRRPPGRSGSSGCTSSTRHRSCRWSRSSRRHAARRPWWTAPSRLVTAWGKVPVRCRDTPGFIVNRVNRPFTLEALAILAEGHATIEGIDGGDPGGRLPDGSVRADGPRRHRRQPGGGAGRLRGVRGARRRRRPSGSGPRRSRRGSSPTDASGARPTRASTCTTPSGAAGRSGARLRVDRRHRARPCPTTRSSSGSRLAVVNEAYRALGDGVATAADIDLAMRLGAGHPIGAVRAGRLPSVARPVSSQPCVAMRPTDRGSSRPPALVAAGREPGPTSLAYHARRDALASAPGHPRDPRPRRCVPCRVLGRLHGLRLPITDGDPDPEPEPARAAPPVGQPVAHLRGRRRASPIRRRRRGRRRCRPRSTRPSRRCSRRRCAVSRSNARACRRRSSPPGRHVPPALPGRARPAGDGGGSPRSRT